MLTKVLIKILVVSIIYFFCCSTHAVTIVHTFTLIEDAGPIVGTVETGSFWYDSEIVPAGGGALYADEPALSIDLTWNGVRYTSNDITVVSMQWVIDQDEFLLGKIFFGTNCNPGPSGSCAVGGSEREFVFYWDLNQTIGTFTYDFPVVLGFYQAELIIDQPNVVPLPGALVFLCSAIFAFSRVSRG